MTQFEKALLSELKGIRKTLEKLNLNNDVAIPAPSELLAMQMAQIQKEKATEVKINAESAAATIYNPLARA